MKSFQICYAFSRFLTCWIHFSNKLLLRHSASSSIFTLLMLNQLVCCMKWFFMCVMKILYFFMLFSLYLLLTVSFGSSLSSIKIIVFTWNLFYILDITISLSDCDESEESVSLWENVEISYLVIDVFSINIRLLTWSSVVINKNCFLVILIFSFIYLQCLHKSSSSSL